MKRIIVMVLGLMLALSCTGLASGAVLFQDDFDDGILDGWHVIPNCEGDIFGEWTAVDGRVQFHRQSDLQGGGYLMVDNFTMPQSFALEFDAVMVEINTYVGSDHLAAFFNFDSWGDHLEGTFRQYIDRPEYDHLILIETINGERLPGQYWEYLVLHPFPADEFQWHHHKYVKEGNSISFYFDGDFIYSYELPVPISGGGLVLMAGAGTHQFDNVVVTTPEPPPVEIDLDLRRFKIRKDKVTGRTVLILRGLPDLPELDLMHGDTVGATITIQLFDVFPDEGDLIISGEEPALRVRDTEDVLVIRKPRF